MKFSTLLLLISMPVWANTDQRLYEELEMLEVTELKTEIEPIVSSKINLKKDMQEIQNLEEKYLSDELKLRLSAPQRKNKKRARSRDTGKIQMNWGGETL